MHPRDTNTAVCINMWAPGTPAKSSQTKKNIGLSTSEFQPKLS